MKSALFVDFDNIYSGLRQLDQATADRFARSPMKWVDWMLTKLALPDHVAGNAKRRILVRRCYLNPQAYQRFRPFFNLAGFEIVDCPALTQGGKTSTDIHMVLDIIDLLQHEAHYDEFIVLSADADFTPVLRKLRRWDRRTTVLAIGFPSAAYRASADLVIDQDAFVRDALGVGSVERASDEQVAPAAASVTAIPCISAGSPTITPGPRLLPASALNVLLENLAQTVRDAVSNTAEPISCARLAALLGQHPDPTDDWHGYGSFRPLLDALPLGHLVRDWRHHGGVVYDPASQRPPTSEQARPPEEEWRGNEAFLAVARQIQEVTGIPLLSPSRYATTFKMLADDVQAHGYNFIDTIKRVRDRCRDRGEPVSRADITFIIRGIVLRGHRFDEQSNTATVLAQQFCNNVRSMCLREQISLDTATETAIRYWLQNGSDQ